MKTSVLCSVLLCGVLLCVVSVTATAPPSQCVKPMNNYCSKRSGCDPAIEPRGCDAELVALYDTDEHHGADQWRCYSKSALNSAGDKYKSGSCYCTRQDELDSVLETCLHPSPFSIVDVFLPGHNDDFFHCFRIPALTVLPNGDLLAFSEGRYPSCADHQHNDATGLRSSDGGRTWHSLSDPANPNVTVIYSESTKSNYVTIGNPAPVYVPATSSVLLPLCRNNKEVILLASSDGGKSWPSKPQELSSQVVKSDWTWVATGPPGGFVASSPQGRVVVPADHIIPNGGTGSHTMISDDNGKSWSLSNDIPGGNECQAVSLSNGSVLMSMRTGGTHRQWALSNDGAKTWGPPTASPIIEETPCEGSIVALPNFKPVAGSTNRLLVLSSSFASSRSNMTLHVSWDEGATFVPTVRVYPGESAYSSLVALNDTTVGLLFERDHYAAIAFAAIDLAHYVPRKA